MLACIIHEFGLGALKLLLHIRDLPFNKLAGKKRGAAGLFGALFEKAGGDLPDDRFRRTGVRILIAKRQNARVADQADAELPLHAGNRHALPLFFIHAVQNSVG